MTAVATRLTTDRLILRQPIASDLDPYVTYCASERSQFVGGPFDAKKAFEELSSMAGHWNLRGFGRYIIVKDGVAIGHVGPLQIDASAPPEFTWTLWDGAFEGQGLATEAARVVHQHLIQDCGWNVMLIQIMPDNVRSRLIAERLGAVLSDDPAPEWYPGALTYYLKSEVSA